MYDQMFQKKTASGAVFNLQHHRISNSTVVSETSFFNFLLKMNSKKLKTDNCKPLSSPCSSNKVQQLQLGCSFINTLSILIIIIQLIISQENTELIKKAK